MSVSNAHIAELFTRYANLLEIQGANPFKVRAYRNASRTVATAARSVAELLAEGQDFDELPGIGKALASKIALIVRTGELPQLVQLETQVPGVLSAFLNLPGLGPKRVQQLYRELQIRSLADLACAIRSGTLQRTPGFGPKLAAGLRAALQRHAEVSSRIPLADAERILTPLLAWLRKTPGIQTVTVAGSFRRRRGTVGDLDIVVTGTGKPPVPRRDGSKGSRPDTRSISLDVVCGSWWNACSEAVLPRYGRSTRQTAEGLVAGAA